MYAARGVGLDTVAEMVERAEGTVRKWLSQWRQTRPSSVVTRHAVGVSAARLKRAQKEELEEVFSKPPSESGVKAGLWDAHGSLRTSRLIRFGARYRSDSSYRLLMRFLGMSLRLPDPFEGRRDEEAIARRMAEIRDQACRSAPGRLGGLYRRRGPCGARGRDEADVASQRKKNKAVRGPGEGEPVVPRGTEPDDQEDEDLPDPGKPERRADPPS